MKEYKINCENAEVKAEAIKLFEALGYRDFDTSDEYLDLVVYQDGDIQSETNDCLTDSDFSSFKQITIEKLRKMAKPTECLVKTDSGWECKVLPKSLIGDAIKIPKKANFAVESIHGDPEFYQSGDSCIFIGRGYRHWTNGGCGLNGRTPIWQRTEKSKFLCLNTEIVSSVKTKNSFELPGGTVKVVFNEENNQNYHAVNGDGLLWCLSAYDKAWYTSGFAGYLEQESTRTVWEINPQSKSKFIVKTKLGYEAQELPKDTPVTWHCIPLVGGVSESDQIGFYELCDKVEAVDFDGAKWMRGNIQNYGTRVIECFTWIDTPQGGDYWRLINDLIK